MIHRTDDGQPIRDLRRARQVFAEMDAGKCRRVVPNSPRVSAGASILGSNLW